MKTNFKHAVEFTLADSTVITAGYAPLNTTGYHAVHDYTDRNKTNPYRAKVWLSEDYEDKLRDYTDARVGGAIMIREHMAKGNLSKAVFLGAYDDTRKAAYVVGRYYADPVGTLKSLSENGPWSDFPADLFDLPLFTELCDEDRKAAIVSRMKQGRLSPKTVIVKFGVEEARKVFWKKFDKQKQDAMFNKYGKDCVVNDMMKLNWNEFDLRYGMEA